MVPPLEATEAHLQLATVGPPLAAGVPDLAPAWAYSIYQ